MHRVVALASCVTIAWLCYRRRQLQRLQELDAGQRSEDPSMADEATYQSTADQSANQSLATRRVKQKVPRRQMLEGKGRGPSNPLRDSGLEQEVVFEFDVNEYDFRGCLQDILDIAPGEALHLLHENDDSLAFIEASNATQFSPKKRPPKIDDNAWPAAPGRHKNPFLRRWKRVWSGGDRDTAKVEALKRFEELLLRFNREFCAPRMGSEPCLFQREPTLRVVFPSPFAQGRPHTDSEYYHQPAGSFLCCTRTHACAHSRERARAHTQKHIPVCSSWRMPCPNSSVHATDTRAWRQR